MPPQHEVLEMAQFAQSLSARTSHDGYDCVSEYGEETMVSRFGAGLIQREQIEQESSDE
jgi:hypothetical protein